MAADRFGVDVAGDPLSLCAWDDAFGQLLDYRGDPLTTLAAANAADDGFALGPAFCAAYRLLGGADPTSPDITTDVARAAARAVDARGRAAADAVALMAEGHWAQAADRLDAHTAAAPRDLFAIKLAHDLRLHNGGLARHLHRAHEAMVGWVPGEPGHGYAAGMLCFALEESGDYAEARRWGDIALTTEPGDAWARHAMAHVYESLGDHEGFTAVLTDAGEHWHGRPLFTNHLWWHAALRSWHHGDVDRAFEIVDAQLTSTTAFGLCDTTAMVWRADLAGHETGERWVALADAWSTVVDVHHSAFVDVHAAVVAATVEGSFADDFWHGLTARTSTTPASENDRTFTEVVRPFGDLVRSWRAGGTHRLGPDAHDALTDKLWHVGGSVVQRQVMHDTLHAIGAAP